MTNETLLKVTELLGSLFKNPIRARRYFHTLVTVSVLSISLYSFYLMFQSYDEIHKSEFLSHGYKYSAYFFSLWCTATQIIYFHMYTVIDIIEVFFKKNLTLIKYTNYIHKAASFLLFTVVFPVSLNVLILFWTVFGYNRDIMYPELLDQYLPAWINHAIHTLPVPLSLVYMFTSNKNIPSKFSCFTALISFLTVYGCVFLNIRIRDGKWVYPGMEPLTPIEISTILACAFIGPVLLFPLGYRLHSLLNGIKRRIPAVSQ